MSLSDIFYFWEQVLIDTSEAGWVVWVFWGVFLVSPILLSFLTFGFLLNKKTKKVKSPSLKITVLVSARNEEQDFPSCIKSLIDLDYPKELLQIILVNDRSEDSTKDIINRFASENDHVLALHTEDMPDTHLEAKARGIAWGMKHASGDWVFITDADGEVNSNWLSHSLSVIDENTGMIGGAIVVEPKGFQGKLERMTWAFVQMFNLGMSGWGVPFACVGPNMAIRRDIYENAGGLENAEFCIAEDLALLKMVENATAKIITPASSETTISIKQVPSFKHYLSQLRRWFRGGVDNGLDYKFILYSSFWFGFYVFTFPFYGWIFSFNVYVILLLLQIISDILLLSTQKYKLGLRSHVKYFLYLKLAQIIAFTYIPLSFLFTRKIHWMGDGYSVDYE